MSTVITSSSSGASEPRGFRRLWRVLRQLFHEVVGALFTVLALMWINSAFRAWTRDVAHWLIAVAIIVGLIFVAFAFTSFRRARQL
jgi:cell division protein FtsW (lipid II flippase)